MPKKETIKTPPTDTPKNTKPVIPSPEIILTEKCKTVSSKSTLTYNIAVDTKSKFYIRVISNTGGGYFSNEWVLIEDITSILKNVDKGESISSIHLFPLFKGKSVKINGVKSLIYDEKNIDIKSQLEKLIDNR